MNNTGINSTIYSVSASCSNCGHKGSITSKKGTEMPAKDACPNCGCWTYIPQTIFTNDLKGLQSGDFGKSGKEVG